MKQDVMCYLNEDMPNNDVTLERWIFDQYSIYCGSSAYEISNLNAADRVDLKVSPAGRLWAGST